MVHEKYASLLYRANRVRAVMALAQYCKRHYFEYATRELAVSYLPPAVTPPLREVSSMSFMDSPYAMGLRGRSYE